VNGMSVRAVRGAIAVERDAPDVVLDATGRLLTALLERNEIATEEIISIFFTVTDDLRSTFPAEAARRMDLGSVPLMCAQEIPVHGAMARVVRVLLHFHTSRSQAEVSPVYLEGAESLRDDL
jgi:chorismate mutase